MMIPTILQTLILSCIGSEEISGRELRERLAKHGFKQSLCGFYQTMKRLEGLKLVEGRYWQQVIAGQIVKQRVYKLSAEGTTALEVFHSRVNALFEKARTAQ